MNEKQVTPKGVIDTLMQFTSREQATNFMESCQFSMSFLREVCKEGSICTTGCRSHLTITDRIVNATTGAKLKHDVLLHCNLHGGGRKPIAQPTQEKQGIDEECAGTDGNETNLTPEQTQWLATASGDELLDSLLNMQFHNYYGCNVEAIANVRREILRRMGESE